MLFNQSCHTLKGVGPKVAARLEKLGIESIQDLLFHLPFRYEDRTHLTRLGALRPNQTVVVEGVIELTEVVFRGRRQLVSRISDGTGFLNLKFFHFSKIQQDNLARGRHVRCFGEVRLGYGGFEIIHPECQFISAEENQPLEDRLTPVYPVTEGLHQLTLRKLIGQAVDRLCKGAEVEELLPKELCEKLHFPSLKEALIYLHRPPKEVDLAVLSRFEHPCQQRLIYEELLAHRFCLMENRRSIQQFSAPVFQDRDQLITQFLKQLPFSLTTAQQRVCDEIALDLNKNQPMLRLVQGDVGSGKTVVAALSALHALSHDAQVALMAPTELLAEQHYANFKAWFPDLGIDLIWLSGSLKGKSKKTALDAIANGQRQMIIGTHALFQEAVNFNRLGFVIIDEQHRFGVHQRLLLAEKGREKNQLPHQLIMTATPIPRTLSMSIYADLDQSIIDELPPGRTPVKTIALDNDRRAEIIERIAELCQSGAQVYWICPLIEESESLQCEAAEKSYEALSAALPNLSIALVHGRMKAEEKERIMQAFKAGKIQLLVATTVIEVGVDVPNASLMVIENAERFGLSQLHQLRGRVGRGAIESHCVLLYQRPLGQTAKARLETMRKEQSGFKIAEKDLALRGPGEVLGTRQTGMLQMRVADLIRDQQWIGKLHDAVNLIYNNHPDVVSKLIKRWLINNGQYLRV